MPKRTGSARLEAGSHHSLQAAAEDDQRGHWPAVVEAQRLCGRAGPGGQGMGWWRVGAWRVWMAVSGMRQARRGKGACPPHKRETKGSKER